MQAPLVWEGTNNLEEPAMNYLILGGVLAMFSLYIVIIAQCLKQPEW